jgi:hypothetical protein
MYQGEQMASDDSTAMTPSVAVARHIEWLEFALAAARDEEARRRERLGRATTKNRDKRTVRLAEVTAEVHELGALIQGLKDLQARPGSLRPAASGRPSLAAKPRAAAKPKARGAAKPKPAAAAASTPSVTATAKPKAAAKPAATTKSTPARKPARRRRTAKPSAASS